MSSFEEWSSTIAGEVYVKVTRGNEIIDQRVPSGGTVLLSTEDRQLNQRLAYSPDADVFSDGTLVPVVLLDTAEDYEDIKANPNLMSIPEMKELLNMNTNAFKKAIKDISSLRTLHLIRGFAEEDDTTSNAMLKAIKDRLSEVQPSPNGEDDESDD